MSHIPAAAAAETLSQVGADVCWPQQDFTGLPSSMCAGPQYCAAGGCICPSRVAAAGYVTHPDDVIDVQGMKDLNLRDEARYQQAPQPEMVSSQVGCGDVAAQSFSNGMAGQAQHMQQRCCYRSHISKPSHCDKGQHHVTAHGVMVVADSERSQRRRRRSEM